MYVLRLTCDVCMFVYIRHVSFYVCSGIFPCWCKPGNLVQLWLWVTRWLWKWLNKLPSLLYTSRHSRRRCTLCLYLYFGHVLVVYAQLTYLITCSLKNYSISSNEYVDMMYVLQPQVTLNFTRWNTVYDMNDEYRTIELRLFVVGRLVSPMVCWILCPATVQPLVLLLPRTPRLTKWPLQVQLRYNAHR